jgi:hypothetical protein
MKYNHMQRGFKEGKERKERNAHFISKLIKLTN